MPAAYVIKAEELSALNYLDADHPEPRLYEWINRGTDLKLRPTTVEMMLRTLFQDDVSPSVARLHVSAGLRVIFDSDQDRTRFATAVEQALALEMSTRQHLLIVMFDGRDAAEQAISQLRDAGVPDDAITLMWRAGMYIERAGEKTQGHSMLSVAAATAGSGIAGTILGAAVLAIPGIGPAAAAGVVAGGVYSNVLAVSGIAGATGGAIARMLSDRDVEGNDTASSATQIDRGRVFVSIDMRIANCPREVAQEILERSGGQRGSRI